MFHDMLPWILFNVFILIMLGIDLLLFRRPSEEVSVKEAIIWSVFWISLAMLFNVYIFYSRGSQDALDFFTAYLIEKSLSVDNLFVFLMIFNHFQTPKSSMHKVLFWGVVGALFMRALFIWFGIILISQFHWIFYVFGAFLVYTGIKLALKKEDEIDLEKNVILRIFGSLFPVAKTYDKNNFFVLKNGKYFATTLSVVLIAIETTDLIFALDSIPAVLAITTDPFIVYTSNIFAILGLRSLYFVLSHVMGLFHYLHYALAFILTFIGIKMLLADIVKIPTGITLGVVFVVLMLSVIASIKYPETDVKGKK